MNISELKSKQKAYIDQIKKLRVFYRQMLKVKNSTELQKMQSDIDKTSNELRTIHLSIMHLKGKSYLSVESKHKVVPEYKKINILTEKSLVVIKNWIEFSDQFKYLKEVQDGIERDYNLYPHAELVERIFTPAYDDKSLLP